MTTGNVQFPPRVRLALMALVVIGALGMAYGATISPERTWANWLLISVLLLTASLGGLFFVAVHYASGATWGVAIRRVPEAMASLMPLGALLILIGFIAHPDLYPWNRGDFGHGTDASLAFKRAWLSRPFFVTRGVVYLAAWTVFAWAICRQSRLQDAGDAPWRTLVNRRLSIAFLVVFAVTFSFAGFDWLMSLEPGWYSTIFSVYQFAGLFLSGLALIVLIAVLLERMGPLAGALTDDHLSDLGKLMLAMSTFWAYIWFSQYMLIWYANIPEETAYFVPRTQGPWLVLFVLNVVLNWAVPFVVLLWRRAKRNRELLIGLCLLLLIGRWLDLYIGILPYVLGARPAIGPIELGSLAGGIGLFGIALERTLRAAPIVPVGDPQLQRAEHQTHTSGLVLDRAPMPRT